MVSILQVFVTGQKWGKCMDRRQRKSRSAIFKAFNSLLGEKAYSNITVQEIIDLADVGRTTFYAHFPTKADLLTELSKEILDHVFSCVPDKEETHDFSAVRQDAEMLISHVFYHIRENRMDIPRIVGSECAPIFLGHFRTRLIEELCARNLIIDSPPVPYDFATSQVAGSFVSTLVWWISEGMNIPPEMLASYFMMSNDRYLRSR